MTPTATETMTPARNAPNKVKANTSVSAKQIDSIMVDLSLVAVTINVLRRNNGCVAIKNNRLLFTRIGLPFTL